MDSKNKTSNSLPSDSVLLSASNAKLCEKCGQIKTLAKIENKITFNKLNEELKETGSTDTIIAYPQVSCTLAQNTNDILTVSQHLSGNKMDIVSIESIGHAIPSTSEKLKKEKSEKSRKNEIKIAISLTDLDLIEEEEEEAAREATLVTFNPIIQKEDPIKSTKNPIKHPNDVRRNRNILGHIAKTFRSKTSK